MKIFEQKAVLLSCFLFLPCIVWAQVDPTDIASNTQDTTNSLIELSLEDLMNVSVATASKKAEKASDAPATIYVITEEQIATRGYSNLEEVLEDIPEIEIQRKSSAEAGNVITIRGIAGNEKFVILQDGIRINSVVGLQHAVNYNFPVNQAKQIEVILGPASALYGVDAFTGIINIITKQGADVNKTQIKTSYGQYNTTDNTLYAGYGKGDYSIAVSGNYYGSSEPVFPDIYKKEYAWFNDKYKVDGSQNNFGFTSKVPIKAYSTPTQAYTTNISFRLKKFQFGFNRNTESHSSSMSYLPEDAVYWSDAIYKVNNMSMYGRYSHESDNGKWGLITTLSHGSTEISPESKFINIFTNYADGYKYDASSAFKMEQQVNFKASEKLNFTGGVTFENFTSIPRTGDLPFAYDRSKSFASQNMYYLGSNIKDSTGKDLTIYQDIYPINYQNYGSYLQGQYTVNKYLSITAGTRFDYNTRFNPTLNPRLGLVITPTSKLKVKLLYGEAYLAPSPMKAYSHYGSFYGQTSSSGQVGGLATSYFFLPNTSLQPEKMRSTESNISYFVNSNIRLGLDGYYTIVTDLITPVITTNEYFKGVLVPTVERNTNSGTAHTYGGTAKVDYLMKVSEAKVNLSLAYSYSDGDLNNNPLPYSAQNTIKSIIEVSFKRFSGAFRYQYRTATKHREYASDNSLTNTAFGLANINVQYKWLNKSKINSHVFVKVNNLFDNRYYNVNYASQGTVLVQTPQDPIRVMGGLRFEF